MNDLQIFQYEQNDIRTILQDGEPWFSATDVCRVLDITNSRDAVSRLDDDEKDVVSTDTLGGKQNINIVNEPGLYSLILGSRKPEAKSFKRWITHEVIPAIRKTGTYSQPMSQLEIMRNMLDVQIQTEKRVDKLEAKVQAAFEKPPSDWCRWINDKINVIVERELLNHQKYRGDLYRELEETAHCDIERRQVKMRQRMREAGYKVTEIKAISKLHVIHNDPKLRTIFEGIVNRESARSA